MNDDDQVKKNKEADILQANFEHYYAMANDHYRKAETTSNILLLIIGAIVTIGFNNGITCSSFNMVSSILVMVIAIFGAIWAGRQMERYRYWQYIALQYQKKLEQIIPDFRRKDYYDEKARNESRNTFPKPFGTFFSWAQDRYLWVILHLIIFIMGMVLLYMTLCSCNSNNLMEMKELCPLSLKDNR